MATRLARPGIRVGKCHCETVSSEAASPLIGKEKLQSGLVLISFMLYCYTVLVWFCCMYFKFLLRFFYPKTTVPMPTESDPVCFRSVSDTYKWASIVIDRVATCFGSSWVHQRLKRWKWNLSTAFSGIGCAETVRILEFAVLHLTANLDFTCRR